jgi:hypothetical protein
VIVVVNIDHVDLGVDRFIDLLAWDLIHEKLKVEGVIQSFWETKSDSHRTDSEKLKFEGGDVIGMDRKIPCCGDVGMSILCRRE